MVIENGVKAERVSGMMMRLCTRYTNPSSSDGAILEEPIDRVMKAESIDFRGRKTLREAECKACWRHARRAGAEKSSEPDLLVLAQEEACCGRM